MGRKPDEVEGRMRLRWVGSQMRGKGGMRVVDGYERRLRIRGGMRMRDGQV
jgi:hypothetical protein